MEFDFNVKGILPGRITVIESKDSNSFLRIYDLESGFDGHQEVNGSWTYSTSCNTPWDLIIKKQKEELETIVDAMGLASARAQNLPAANTTLKNLLQSCQQKIYIIRDASQWRSIIGMLKIGIKRLIVRDDLGTHHEVDPVCILDFYVHESTQRCGFGHELFNAMLQAQGVKPEKLAVDGLSFKCLAFLEKHYNLKDPSKQNNNFVIYPGFLENRNVTRPAIFLSDNKVPDPQLMKLKNLSNDNNKDPMKDFQPIQALNTKGIMSKSYSASTGNLLLWDESEVKSEYNYRKKIKDPNIFPVSPAANTTMKDFQPMQALNTKGIKSKGYYASTGNLLHWDESEVKPEYNYHKKVEDPNIFPVSPTTNTYLNKERKDWGVTDAMHSFTNYSVSSKECGGWNPNSNSRNLSPADTGNVNQRKLNSLQSSWNVLGVVPMNYAPQPKQTLKE